MKKITTTVAILFTTAFIQVQAQTSVLQEFIKDNAEQMAFYVKKSKPTIQQNKAKKAKNLSSEELAFATVKESAENGYIPAQDLLAYCYATGAGTKVNKVLAFCWYLQAAYNGSRSAKESLISCFEQGIGVTRNIEIARVLRAALPEA